MLDIFNNMGFIIAFLILTLVFQLAFGSEFANKFLLLVLFGMLIINAEDFIALLNKSFTIK